MVFRFYWGLGCLGLVGLAPYCRGFYISQDKTLLHWGCLGVVGFVRNCFIGLMQEETHMGSSLN